MNPNAPPERQVSPGAWNPLKSERLYRRRLDEVLGINGAGVEVMLRLRHQVIALQSRVRQLEAELVMWEARQNTRLTQHRKAAWRQCGRRWLNQLTQRNGHEDERLRLQDRRACPNG